jgi:undecaprenyl-diphosphatase
MNYHLFQVINGWAGRNDGIDDVMEFTATTVIYLIFAAAALIGLQALYLRRIRPLMATGAALALAFAIATVTSRFSSEVRPFQTHRVVQLIPHEAGASLPSDHAVAAFTIAAAIAVFLHRRWAVLLAGAALAIGFARIWVGVHYPGDIAAALVIALTATAAIAAADRLLQHRRREVHARVGDADDHR